MNGPAFWLLFGLIGDKIQTCIRRPGILETWLIVVLVGWMDGIHQMTDSTSLASFYHVAVDQLLGWVGLGWLVGWLDWFG